MTRLGFTPLRKELTLFDVYVIATGPMLSAGLFLLPGIAVTYAGASAVIAYLAAGVLVLPALLSLAELATAMPRAGGAYYFLDRTLGPLVGTIGGIGSWLTLVLKTAFALIGIGSYLALVLDVPVVPTALAVALGVLVLNAVGARESSGVMRVLVVTLLVILAYFVIHGLWETTRPGSTAHGVPALALPHGVDGLLSTVGLVFIAYVSLAKVASVAEEVENPDRNIPLGMLLALLTATAFFGVGIFVMLSVLGPARLAGSLTPAADTAAAFTSWLPRGIGMWLMVGAAVVAYAASANAGLLAASRYPLAMARDRLFPAWLARTGTRGGPMGAVLLTGVVLALALLTLDVAGVAKLASALQLLIFGLVNVAVIVMRESHIDAYDPGFHSPLYPWTQLAGLFVPLVLVAEMGWMPVLFTIGVTAACVAWYTYYAQPRIARDGAIFHVFERLGRRRFAGLDRELRDLMKEKGLREEDPFDEVVARARVLDRPGFVAVEEIIAEASLRLAELLPVSADALIEAFGRGVRMGGAPVAHGAALLHTRLPEIDLSEMVLVRCQGGLRAGAPDGDEIARQAAAVPIRAVFFLVSGERDPGRHLRILAQLAGRVEEPSFASAWASAADEQELKETLLRDDRFLSLKLRIGTAAQTLIGRAVSEIELPAGCLIALIRRRGEMLVPQGPTVLREGDRLTIIGSPVGLRQVTARFVDGHPLGPATETRGGS